MYLFGSDLERYKDRLAQASRKAEGWRSEYEENLKPVTDPTLWRRLRNAQRIIRSHPVPHSCWQGPLVRQIALEFGNRRPVFEGSSDTDTNASVNPAMMSGIRLAAGFSTCTAEENADTLIHEASHLAHWRWLQRLLGWDNLTLYAMLMRNDLVGNGWSKTTELVAYTNDAAWSRKGADRFRSPFDMVMSNGNSDITMTALSASIGYINQVCGKADFAERELCIPLHYTEGEDVGFPFTMIHLIPEQIRRRFGA